MAGLFPDRGVPLSPLPRSGYIPGLDGIRLVAVMIVIIAHFEFLPNVPGGMGVTVFFAISGFLIARLLLAEEDRTGTIALPQFFARRLIRLMPPLLLMLALTVPVYAISNPERFSVLQVFSAAFYMANIYKLAEYFHLVDEGLHEYGVLWSLAVEEHFYLVFPFFLLAVRDIDRRIKYIIFILAFALALRIAVYPFSSDPEVFNYYFTLTRMDSIGWGVLLTLLLVREDWQKRLQSLQSPLWLAIALAIILFGLAWRVDFFQDTFKYTVHGIGLFLLLNAVLFSPSLGWMVRIAEWRPIRTGGRISYEMYLWHVHAYFLVLYLMPEGGMVMRVVALVVTVAISLASYELTSRFSRAVGARFGSRSVEEVRAAFVATRDGGDPGSPVMQPRPTGH